MKLFLDDVRRSPTDETWVTVQTYEDAIMILATNWQDITEVSLDHDLGTFKTGYDVLVYIEVTAHDKGNLPMNIWVHSQNPVAQITMQAVVKSLYETFRKETTP